MKNLSSLLTLCVVMLITPAMAQATIFFDDFNSVQFKPQWTPLPGPGGTVELADGVGFNNTRGVRMGRTTNGGLTTNDLDLRLNLLNRNRVELTFDILRLPNETTHPEDGLYFSQNGITFIKVLDFNLTEWCSNRWGQYPPIEVSKLAEKYQMTLTNQFVIRFRQRDKDAFNWGNGFQLDNVRVYESDLAYFEVTSSQKFCDNFETGKLGRNWAWRFADSTNTLAATPTLPSNITGVYPNLGYESSFAVILGKDCNDGFTTNALDLHLDLSAVEAGSTVELTFLLYDYSDETHIDDGIYFSNDGGVSFAKIFDFLPDGWCNNYWGQLPPIDIVKCLKEKNINMPLTDKCIIRFQQHDDLNFIFSDGLRLDDVCVYIPPLTYFKVTSDAPGVPGTSFFDDFETGQLQPWWAVRFADATCSLCFDMPPARISNVNGVFSNIGLNSQYAVAMGKNCHDGFAANALDLHLDLSAAGLSDVEMTYWIYDYGEITHIDDGIYFSNDGGENFKKIYNFRPSDWCDNSYGQLPPINIAKLANMPLTDKCVIRFQQYDDLDFIFNDGIRLDDIHVYIPNLIYASLPFYDDFETGDLQPMWARRFADQTSLPAQHVTKPSNIAEVFPNIGEGNSYGLAMGKSCADGFMANAIDLHLNLQGATDAALNYALFRNFNEQTHIQDGIYFSNDGGVNFVKVYDFIFASIPANQWVNMPPLDINALATSKNLALTNQFVIRFQQYGDQATNSNGIRLDNINVTGTISNTTTLGQPSLVHIFPNPTRDVLAISGLPTQTTTFQVHDAQGSIVQSGQVNGDFQLETNTLSPGLYFVECRQGAGVWQGRFVKL